MDEAFEVETALGRSASVIEAIDDCMIEIEGRKFPVRLFLLSLGGFDVVLGMDWLSTYEAQISCRRKMVALRAPDGCMVTVYGEKLRTVRPQISYSWLINISQNFRKIRHDVFVSITFPYEATCLKSYFQTKTLSYNMKLNDRTYILKF